MPAEDQDMEGQIIEEVYQRNASENHDDLDQCLSANGFDMKNIMACFPSDGEGWWPPVFQNLLHRQAELICSRNDDPPFVFNLPDRIHPIFAYNTPQLNYRWSGITQNAWIRMKPALLLASYLLYNNTKVKRLLARILWGQASANGVNHVQNRKTKYGTPVLIPRFDQLPNGVHLTSMVDSRLTQLAPFVRFKAGIGYEAGSSEEALISTHAETADDNAELVHRRHLFNFVQHRFPADTSRGGHAVIIGLNELLLSYARNGRLTYTNELYHDDCMPLYDDYKWRAHFAVAVTLIHEITHAVEMLSYNSFWEEGEEIWASKQPLLHPDALADPDQSCDEVGYEMEAHLFGGCRLETFHRGAGWQEVAPIYGLGLREQNFMRNWPQEKELGKTWLCPMKWIKFWFSKENLDDFERYGTDALPPLIEWVFLENIKNGGGEFFHEPWQPRPWTWL